MAPHVGRYDTQLAPALERLAALRAEEAKLWLEVKASDAALKVLMERWADSCSALRREQEHADAIAFLAQLEAGLCQVNAT